MIITIETVYWKMHVSTYFTLYIECNDEISNIMCPLGIWEWDDVISDAKQHNLILF